MGDYNLKFFQRTVLLDTIPPCKHICKLYLRVRKSSQSDQPVPPRLMEQPTRLWLRALGALGVGSETRKCREPRLPAPERYDGAPGECRAFVTQCQLIFHLQPLTFPTDDARVAYVFTQLTGRAKKWGTSAWANDRPCIRSSDHFLAELQRVFDRSSTGPEAGRELMRLRQGKASVSDYAIDFQTLAADGGWEGRPLVDAFIHGLTHEMRDELLAWEVPDDLKRLISLAI